MFPLGGTKLQAGFRGKRAQREITVSPLIQRIRQSIIGSYTPIETPFGSRPLVYADYTASGRALTFVEDFIRDRVLPYYANTHTETTFTGAQITALREQARNIIRSAVGGGRRDKVIFCGSGATSAINKLVDILDLRSQQPAGEKPAARPVVFIGPYEHHSNELPWRESNVDVVTIPLDQSGLLDLGALKHALDQHEDRPLKIGSFSAASNVTGLMTDVQSVTALLKRHGALAFWDYAAAAPYVPIDMNAALPLDAVFISPHKFVGGPGTPGVLVVKEHLITNAVPTTVGGGTVRYVSPEHHSYVDDPERREEGGTPAIVESIRAGLAFKIQQDVGFEEITQRESSFIRRAIQRLSRCDNLEILGPTEAPRLAILSLRFKHAERDLHYGYVVSVLNDLFGIQVRGGCSCAGPYGHSLLGMDMPYSLAIEDQIAAGHVIFRPGWVRLNFNYFISEDEFEYLLRAIELVAEHGWCLLPHYRFDATTGLWQVKGAERFLPVDLDQGLYHPGVGASAVANNWDWNDLLQQGERIMLRESAKASGSDAPLPQHPEPLRWFALSDDLGIDRPL